MTGRLRLVDLACACLLVAGLLWLGMHLQGERLTGSVRIVDGDTLVLDGRRVRLKGLDAPELAQTCRRGGAEYRCGEVAREALRAMAEAAEVTCRLSGRDRYGRDLGTCRVRDADLGGDLVRRGLAVAFGDYEAEERLARSERAGLWAGSFETPRDWRRRHQPPDAR